MIQEMGCDAAVVGRGRRGCLWFLVDIVLTLSAGPVFYDLGLGEVVSVIEKHARWVVEGQGGEGRAMCEMHKHLG